MVHLVTPKRKRLQEESKLSMDELNQDLLEKVLSWLPASSFFRSTSVCKRWKAVADSNSFKLACSQVPYREPCFFMVDPHLNRSIIFDSAENNWKSLRKDPNQCHYMPVAASGGLICFINHVSKQFVISNPLTRSSRQLPDVALPDQPIHAVAMSSTSSNSYKLVLVYGELPRISSKIYDSDFNRWGEEIIVNRKVDDVDSVQIKSNSDDESVYFLSKAGNVVATNLTRSPSKQYSSVVTLRNNETIVYFVSSLGTIVAVNLARKHYTEYPRLLPAFTEYSIDVVESRGEMLVVLLSEFFESATLRVWKYDEEVRLWVQKGIMPPSMSREFYGKKVDINCIGAGERILVCLNSADLFRYVICDLVTNEWTELPECVVDCEAIGFGAALSFEPRIEAEA